MFSFFNASHYLKDTLPGFVDIHNHILPGIDDGAKDIETSLQLIERLRSLGVTKFINTPHTMNDYYPNTIKTITNASSNLQDALQKAELNDIYLKPSSEYMMDGHFEKLLENHEILPLHDKYVLVEMSYFQPPFNLEEILYEINVAGYIPVLAHPERYAFYHGNYEYYNTLKMQGCKLQLNMLSLSNQYGSGVTKTAHRLLQENKYDFIGSDIHHERHINNIEKLKLKKSHFQSIQNLIEATSSTFDFT